MYLADNKSTTLSSAITSGSTSLTSTDTGLGSPSGLVEFSVDYDNPTSYEKMTGVISGTSVSGLTRGVGGTTAVSHAAGAKIAIVHTKEHYDLVANFAKTGWTLLDPQTISLASVLTFSYVSANSFTVTGDWTSTLSVGDKIRLVNNSTTKYFFVESVSYSSPDSTIGVKDGITRTTTVLSSGTITNVNYSKLDSPSGFPASASFFDEAIVTMSGSQSIPHNTDTAINFGAEALDSNVLHDNVTNSSRVTVRQAGMYHLRGSLAYVNQTGTTSRIVQYRKNGGTPVVSFNIQIGAPNDTAGNDMAVLFEDWVYLAANDYIEMTTLQASGGALSARSGKMRVKLLQAY